MREQLKQECGLVNGPVLVEHCFHLCYGFDSVFLLNKGVQADTIFVASR